MKTQLVVVAIALSMLVAACGSNGGGGTVDKGMLDAIQGYTESIYQAQVDRFPTYICKEHVDTMTKQVQDTGIPPSTSGNTYDISGITFKVDSLNGDVAKLSIVSGELKVTDKNGKVLTPLTAIPGSANGIVLKNENGWKVC